MCLQVVFKASEMVSICAQSIWGWIWSGVVSLKTTNLPKCLQACVFPRLVLGLLDFWSQLTTLGNLNLGWFFFQIAVLFLHHVAHRGLQNMFLKLHEYAGVLPTPSLWCLRPDGCQCPGWLWFKAGFGMSAPHCHRISEYNVNISIYPEVRKNYLCRIPIELMKIRFKWFNIAKKRLPSTST